MATSLSACGGGEISPSRPNVSKAEIPVASGMTYEQFKSHPFNHGADMAAVQKRFILLDRNHNGRLSADEFNGI